MSGGGLWKLRNRPPHELVEQRNGEDNYSDVYAVRLIPCYNSRRTASPQRLGEGAYKTGWLRPWRDASRRIRTPQSAPTTERISVLRGGTPETATRCWVMWVAVSPLRLGLCGYRAYVNTYRTIKREALSFVKGLRLRSL